jgi:hypothetical protein
MRVKVEALRAASRQALEAERDRLEQETQEENRRVSRLLRAAADEERARERASLASAQKQARELLSARQAQAAKERDTALAQCEEEWAAELARALSALRERLGTQFTFFFSYY